MDVLNNLDFLRQDNANLLKEIQSLRLHSTLLRERSQELERKLREASGEKDPKAVCPILGHTNNFELMKVFIVECKRILPWCYNN